MEVSKLTEISNLVLEAVELASDIVMEVYNSGDLKVEDKHDGSPVTIADKKCHEILFNSLKSIDANIPILSEEGDTKENREDLFVEILRTHFCTFDGFCAQNTQKSCFAIPNSGLKHLSESDRLIIIIMP